MTLFAVIYDKLFPTCDCCGKKVLRWTKLVEYTPCIIRAHGCGPIDYFKSKKLCLRCNKYFEYF